MDLREVGEHGCSGDRIDRVVNEKLNSPGQKTAIRLPEHTVDLTPT